MCAPWESAAPLTWENSLFCNIPFLHRTPHQQLPVPCWRGSTKLSWYPVHVKMLSSIKKFLTLKKTAPEPPVWWIKLSFIKIFLWWVFSGGGGFDALIHLLIIMPTFPTSVISQSSIKISSKLDVFPPKPVISIPLPAYKICSLEDW